MLEIGPTAPQDLRSYPTVSGCHCIGSSTSRTQSGTSCGGGYGSLGRVFLILDARRNIYVARDVMCATYILQFARCAYMRGLRFTLDIEGCRRSHVAATTEDNPRTLVVPMERGSYFIFSFFISEGLRGAVMSLYLQRAAHSVEHRTAFYDALHHVFKSRYVRLDIHVARTADGATAQNTR